MELTKFSYSDYSELISAVKSIKGGVVESRCSTDKSERECVAADIESRMMALANEAEAHHLMRFFKTGPGGYGEGDRFLGIRVPVTRALVRKFRERVMPDDVERLTSSPWHEIRLAGFLALIDIYGRAVKSGDESIVSGIVEYYLSILHRGNNWDLVDVIAPKILGDYLVVRPGMRTKILDGLASMEGKLWHQRVAIVATWTLIRNGEFADSMRIAERYLMHRHDLIHKAAGWMLREVGKRGGMPELLGFLDRYASRMPRTMLRYAIEQLSPDKRIRYLALR